MINGNLVGKVNKNGTLSDKNDQVLIKITDENIVQNTEGKALIKIDKNGTMHNGSGILITWSEKGELIKGTENTGITISPSDKHSLQTASVVLFTYLSIGK